MHTYTFLHNTHTHITYLHTNTHHTHIQKHNTHIYTTTHTSNKLPESFLPFPKGRDLYLTLPPNGT